MFWTKWKKIREWVDGNLGSLDESVGVHLKNAHVRNANLRGLQQRDETIRFVVDIVWRDLKPNDKVKLAGLDAQKVHKGELSPVHKIKALSTLIILTERILYGEPSKIEEKEVDETVEKETEVTQVGSGPEVANA